MANTIQDITELKDYFHPGAMMFTNDSKEQGIDNRLISCGLQLDMGISRQDLNRWYLKGRAVDVGNTLVRYHPINSEMTRWSKVAEEGLHTRIDFLAGCAPIMYSVGTALLDDGWKVGVCNKSDFLQFVSVFAKQGDLYALEKVVSLRGADVRACEVESTGYVPTAEEEAMFQRAQESLKAAAKRGVRGIIF